MQQKVGSNGIDKVGDPYQILTNSDSSVDGPDVEAPSIAKFSDGRYVLFFSSNCYTTINYNVNYATASSKFSVFPLDLQIKNCLSCQYMVR